ncbi:hypothetical protein BDW66DRAFT_165055 [Aspergillus desertorum]
MVSLQAILAHNVSMRSSLSPGLVAVFVGATSGIGAATLKAFSKDDIAECKTLNPAGEYIFIEADISLIRVIDEVCARIAARETQLNILFLSQGIASLDRSKTSEGLNLLTSLTHYSRIRFTANLLPLLQRASSLRRVVTVGAAGFEGPIDTSDFEASRVPPVQVRGHMASLMTFGIEALAQQAPSVAFIHDYPGTVDTPLTRKVMSGTRHAPVDWMDPTESGERHDEVPRLTSLDGDTGPSDPGVVRGMNGDVGSGFYAVGSDGECVSAETLGFVDALRKAGMVNMVWKHTLGEFERIVRTAREG